MARGNRESQTDGNRTRDRQDHAHGSHWSSVLCVAGIALAYTAVEIAFKPWLRAGRRAIRKSIDPNYDVDDELDERLTPAQKARQLLGTHDSDDDDDDIEDLKKKTVTEKNVADF